MRTRRKRRRGVLCWLRRLTVAALGLIALAGLALFAAPLYDRYVTYPALARDLAVLRAQAEPVVALDDGWTEFRSAIHAHSGLSHDSEISFPEILAAALEAKVEVMFMIDHCIENKADFSLQWTGLHDGVHFVRGWEIRDQLLIWALPPDTTLDCARPIAELVDQVQAKGGVSAFAHNDEPRPYELHDVAAMEIYDLRDDFRDEKLWQVLPGLLVNGWAWPELAIRELYDRQDAILAKWDAQNRSHPLAGIGSADAHQNLGLRAVYTSEDHLRIHQSSKKLLLDLPLNALTRPLLQWVAGPLEPGRELFRVDLDPYARSLRYVNTHLLAQDNSEAALLDALRKGRAFVAFNLVADAKGFVLFAEDGARRVTFGETIDFSPHLKLRGAAPLPARWTVHRDGEVVASSEGRTFDWRVPQAGNYRLELALKVGEAWVDWIQANPIRVRAPAG